MSNDLYLKYRFTDRGGNRVYDIFSLDYDPTEPFVVSPLGEARLKPEQVTPQGDDDDTD